MSKPVILGIDEHRSAQGAVASAFNEQGVTYRFVTDCKKVLGGVRQLAPDLVMVFGELSSDFVIQALDALASDVLHRALPVVVCAEDTADLPFVIGMRSSVVALLPRPFGPEHVAAVKGLWLELPSRPGTVTGQGDARVLARLADHIRRTRRSGILTTQPRTANEGRATFVRGRLERAAFLGQVSQDALKAMLAQPTARWSFQEVAGQHGEGAGVVIEVGELAADETEVADIVVGHLDEPLAFEVDLARPSAPPPPPPSVAPVTATAPTALLLVDDDEALLRMFSTLFAKHGFHVTTAVDGRAGVEATLQREFDVVLADLNMPRLDGWGLLRVLRENFRTRELPVAFISAHDDYRESLRALNAGAQAYLSKGTRLDALVGLVKKLLDPRRDASARLDSTQPFTLSVSTVGPQWLLRQLAARKVSGRLAAKDGWAQYTLAFADGVCSHASAVAGKFKAEGERAFNAFVASRSAEATWSPGPSEPLPANVFLSTAVMIERACSTLNENEQRMRDNLMVTATEIAVNAELYAIYAQVGPKQWLEAARLICEEKLPPRDVIARVDMSPLEVEETMKDLIRRGVVTLKRTP